MGKAGSRGKSVGMYGNVGAIVKCEATNNSVFCIIMKLFNIMIVMITVVCFMYLFSYLIYPNIKKKIGFR